MNEHKNYDLTAEIGLTVDYEVTYERDEDGCAVPEYVPIAAFYSIDGWQGDYWFSNEPQNPLEQLIKNKVEAGELSEFKSNVI